MENSAKKNRSSNFELLRIILMCMIPVYHVMLYNGVMNEQGTPNGILGLILTTGSAIPADYAFMALSSYFLTDIEDKPIRSIIRKLLTVAAKVFTLWLLKTAILRGLFGFNNPKYFVDLFLINGAWWFIYTYLIILCIYPVLNMVIRALPRAVHIMLIILMSGVLCYNSYVIEASWYKDLFSFVLVYLVTAYLKKRPFKLPAWAFLIFYVCGYAVLLGFSLYMAFNPDIYGLEEYKHKVLWMVSRYCPVGALM